MSHFFETFTNFVCRSSLRRPFLWFFAALLLTVPAVMQFSRVGLDTDLIRLLPEESRAAKLKKQMDVLATGSGGGFFAILLESGDNAQLTRAYETLLRRLDDIPDIGRLDYENPVDFYRTYRYSLVPSESLERVLDFFIRLESRVNPMGEDLLSDDGEENTQETGETQEDREKKDKSEIKKMMRYLDLPRYHQSEDGHVMAVKVFPLKGITSLGKTRRMFHRLEQLTREISREFLVWGGVGGSQRNSIDQYDFIISDLADSGLITLIMVLAALVIGFRGLRVLPVVLLPLFLGLAWTLGSIPMLVGDLNTITSFLLLVSFGLGIDFSIHLVKRFTRELNHLPLEEALLETFRSTGKSIAISGLTTALALLILSLSNFRGFSEFGVVGGYSLIMILIAMLLFLPGLMVLGVRFRLLRPHRDNGAKGERGRRIQRALVPGKMVTLVILAAVLVSLLLALWGVSFNYDFSKMDVRVPGEQEIKDRFYRVYESVRSPAAIFGVKGTGALDELLGVLKKGKEGEEGEYKNKSRIEKFHGIRDLCPGKGEYKNRLDWIAEIQDVVKGRWINRVEDKDYKKWIEDIRQWSPPERGARLEDLPEHVRNRFASHVPDHYLVPVYIEGEKQKGKNAMAFTNELFELPAPKGTIGPFGETTVLAEVLEVVTSEGPWLVVITFLAIFGLIFINQRSVVQTAWIMLPLVTGMVLTAGIMVVFGLRLNFFNVVVFPTLIGMGVDDGVHYYRRWAECNRDVSSTQEELFGPLTLTSATTIFGYIGIVFSSHPGLRSIGILACIGLACTWFTSLFLLPGILNLLKRR